MTSNTTHNKMLLEEAGILYPCDTFDAVGKQLGDLLGAISRRVVSQAAHDVINNQPMGMDCADIPRHAVNSGLVSAIGELLEWCIDDVG